jgi:hypothetical protein
MPWKLTSRGEGKPPTAESVAPDYQPQAGEIVVDELPSENEVWDSGLGGMRPKTSAELLEEARHAKLDEFADRAIEDLQGLFTDPHGRDELQSLHNAYIVQIAQALNIPLDPRLVTVSEVTQHALAKKEEVLQAATVEGLEAVEWEEPS